ncbi:hypothetical protein GWK47_001459 [Chionoecetes opilio]|uniref:Uncharacterized protein n=1 Tax=Chionoecetes opilio TaxID=41210 RepID=A0A8J4XXV8_CHIOP|nr:hypothetical protein GWK47_001459 [Chionoecetes opilio]
MELLRSSRRWRLPLHDCVLVHTLYTNEFIMEGDTLLNEMIVVFPLTVRHLLVECPSLRDLRVQFLSRLVAGSDGDYRLSLHWERGVSLREMKAILYEKAGLLNKFDRAVPRHRQKPAGTPKLLSTQQELPAQSEAMQLGTPGSDDNNAKARRTVRRGLTKLATVQTGVVPSMTLPPTRSSGLNHGLIRSPCAPLHRPSTFYKNKCNEWERWVSNVPAIEDIKGVEYIKITVVFRPTTHSIQPDEPIFSNFHCVELPMLNKVFSIGELNCGTNFQMM